MAMIAKCLRYRSQVKCTPCLPRIAHRLGAAHVYAALHEGDGAETAATLPPSYRSPPWGGARICCIA